MGKMKVAILFGGQSAEHEISLQSAKNIIEALDPNKYELILIGIDKNGHWHFNEQTNYLLNAQNPKTIKLNLANSSALTFTPGKEFTKITSKSNEANKIDVIFPILHGPLGEDGTIQGLLRVGRIPFVGADVMASSICMDKDISKRLFAEAKLPQTKFITVHDWQLKTNEAELSYQKLTQELESKILFIKPANMGSSVGISKVTNEKDWDKAIAEAFSFDRKIIIEAGIDHPREIEVAILGNERPKASIPGEIIPLQDFYSYQAKYIDEKGAKLLIPANLSPSMVKEIQQMAIKAFQVLGLEGMGRVDFLLDQNDQLYLNEINSIPGFTKISMYPQLWQASGLSYSQLLDELINLAIDREEKRNKLKTSYLS